MNSNSLLPTKPNFRDLGGTITLDGHRIKRELLFRSSNLGHLTEIEIAILEKFGLKTIIDFRSPREIEHRPNKEIGSVQQTINLIIHDRSREKATWFLHHHDAEGLETLLIDDYRRMVRENQAEFSAFLKSVAQPELFPLVYHCAAGKDRTGLATVFLFTALGVDFPVIFEDYMITNQRNAIYTENMIQQINGLGYQGELMRPMLEVRKEYLDAALEVIQLEYGGLWNYVVDALHADVDHLRSVLLENH